MQPSIDLLVEADLEESQKPVLGKIDKIIGATVSIGALKFPEGAELSLLITDDRKLQTLNLDWRGKDKPTNVLSFPGQTIEVGETAGDFLGDIAVSIETTQREAKETGKSFADHFTHLIVHGFLHLFGYDHENDEDAEEMENLERNVLAELGISDPYNDE